MAMNPIRINVLDKYRHFKVDAEKVRQASIAIKE
jgi:hypothetical protein